MPFKQWTDGEVLTESDLDRFLVQQSHVIKTLDESYSSGVGGLIQDDNELFIPVLANSHYHLEYMLVYTAKEGEDMEIGWSVPTGSVLEWTHGGLAGGHPSGGTDNTAIGRISRNKLSTTTQGWIGGVENGSAEVILSGVPGEGHLRTAGTAGNLQFRFGSHFSSAVGIILYAGTTIILQKLTQ